MTKIKTNIVLDDACTLTVTDITGFSSGSNATGFLPESDITDPALNVYKLSQGYFINLLIYNKYACPPVLVNPSESFYKVTTPVTTYNLNFTASVYKLILDGTYTLKRYFIPSLEYFETTAPGDLWDDVTQYYSDGEHLYKIVETVPVIVTVSSLLQVEDETNFIFTSTNFISTCYTNSCYFKLLNILVDLEVTDCTQPKILLEQRDLLYMTLEIIQYLKEKNNITQIQKLIEAVDICGGICAKTLKAISPTNCGCHG